MPSAWLTPVGDWVINRQYAVGTVASLVLFVAIVAAARTRFSRAGSTALLAVVVLTQVELGHLVLIAAVVVPTGLWLARLLTIRTARRMSWTEPGWTAPVAEWGVNVSEALILAATYLFSPLGWLISQESHLPRGSRQNPLHIEQVAPAPQCNLEHCRSDSAEFRFASTEVEP